MFTFASAAITTYTAVALRAHQFILNFVRLNSISVQFCCTVSTSAAKCNTDMLTLLTLMLEKEMLRNVRVGGCTPMHVFIKVKSREKQVEEHVNMTAPFIEITVWHQLLVPVVG